jgi:hypothetical protein
MMIVMSGIQLDRVRATATADLGFAADLLYARPAALKQFVEDHKGAFIQ